MNVKALGDIAAEQSMQHDTVLLTSMSAKAAIDCLREAISSSLRSAPADQQ